jgi:hypothetical protein
MEMVTIPFGGLKMTRYETWNLFFQMVMCIATFLVAIVAIWGDLIRSWWLGPKLRVILNNADGELTNFTNGKSVRYYHLRVVNDRDWAPARNVKVLVKKILRPAADGHWVDCSFSGPLQLAWQFPKSHPRFPFIGPDDVCDLGCVIKGERFALRPYETPNNFTGYIAKNEKILVEVAAIADNGKSKPIRIEIAWDGEWNDNEKEMSRHLVVKLVKEIRAG